MKRTEEQKNNIRNGKVMIRRNAIQHYFAEYCEANGFKLAKTPTDSGGMFISRSIQTGDYEIRRVVNDTGTSRLVLSLTGTKPIEVAKSLKVAAVLAKNRKLN